MLWRYLSFTTFITACCCTPFIPFLFNRNSSISTFLDQLNFITSSFGHHRWRPVTLLIPKARSHRSSYFSFASRRCSRGNGIPKRRFCKNCCASSASIKTNLIFSSYREFSSTYQIRFHHQHELYKRKPKLKLYKPEKPKVCSLWNLVSITNNDEMEDFFFSFFYIRLSLRAKTVRVLTIIHSLNKEDEWHR